MEYSDTSNSSSLQKTKIILSLSILPLQSTDNLSYTVVGSTGVGSVTIILLLFTNAAMPGTL